MTKDRGHRHSIHLHAPFRINPEHLAKISRQLARLLIDLCKIRRIVQPILADLKLDPSVIAAPLTAGTASPRLIIPGHRLNRRNTPVSQLPDPGIQARLYLRMVPVIPVSILPDQPDQSILIRRIIIRLHIPLQRRIIRSGTMPEHALHLRLPRTLITGTLSHHADHRLILLTVLHRDHRPFYHPSQPCHEAVPAPYAASPVSEVPDMRHSPPAKALHCSDKRR